MAPKTKTAAPAAPKAAPKKAAAAPAAKKAPAPKKAPAAKSVDAETGKKVLSPVPMPLAKKVAEAVQEEVKVSQKDVKAICEAFIRTIVKETMSGNTVALPNFFTLKRVLRKARTHKNPQTKEEIHKPAHFVLSMDVKTNLKQQFEKLDVTDAPAPKAKKAQKGGAADVADTAEPVAPAVTA